MASRFATVSADDIITTNKAGVPTIPLILLHYSTVSFRAVSQNISQKQERQIWAMQAEKRRRFRILRLYFVPRNYKATEFG